MLRVQGTEAKPSGARPGSTRAGATSPVRAAENPTPAGPGHQGLLDVLSGRRELGLSRLQRSAGNRTVIGLLEQSRPGSVPAVQRKREDKPGLLAMTVADFDRHRKAEQMDWPQTAGLTETERKAVWGIIDWGTGGLAGFLMSAVLAEVAKGPAALAELQAYCAGVNGTLDGQPTVALSPAADVEEARKQGRWLRRLTNLLGPATLKNSVPPDSFLELVKDESAALKFESYVRGCRPLIESGNGSEVGAFLQLVKEGGNPLGYVATLPDIRNYHRFSKAVLDRLVEDKAKKDRPLTLILYTAYDHNGAFHRHSGVQAVILNANTRSYLIESMDLGKLRSLTGSGFDALAAAHGMEGKITQVMVAGHGGSTEMQLATSSGRELRLNFSNDDYNSFWTSFFEALFKNMELKGGLSPKVLLRACLTNSSQVDTEKLKKEMKAKGLDVDNIFLDPTTDKNQATIRTEINAYLAKYGSLASVLGQKAGGRAAVLGANASIDARTTESVKSSGELDIVAKGDPYVGGTKINYVRYGKEPVGALKAVIEEWAKNPDACFEKMEERALEVVPPGARGDFVIQTLYNLILDRYKKNITGANRLTNTAHALDAVLKGTTESRVAQLTRDPGTQDHKSYLYPLMVDGFASPAMAKLVVYQDWLPDKNDELASLLGEPENTWRSVRDYIDFAHLKPKLDALFTTCATATDAKVRGGIVLALVGTLDSSVQEECKKHLLTMVADAKLPKAVIDELGGASPDRLRAALGLPIEQPEVPMPVVLDPLLPPEPEAPPNTAEPGASANTFYVAPMRTETRKMTKSTLTDWAKLMPRPDTGATPIEEFYRNREFVLVGEVSDRKTKASLGWYQVRQDNGLVAYMQTKYF